MKIARTPAELRELRPSLTGRIVLVPTMGALHDGHLSLISAARQHGDAVIVSIFVNPLQFGAGEDFTSYPRPIDDDLAACAAAGVDLVFAPVARDLIGAGPEVRVSAGRLGTLLEGSSRPGHFDGVLTIVLKLINLTRPQLAVFGEKDAQQLACIRQMISDLDVGVEIVGAPIIREPDGLALSSRNTYLSPDQRSSALALSRALDAAAAEARLKDALEAARTVITVAEQADPEVRADYVELVDPSTFLPLVEDDQRTGLLLLAVRVGRTRLIDNRLLTFG